MSIELPPIPPPPNADSTPEQLARYLDIARLYVSRESSEAIDRQTAQMVLMTAAAERSATLMQQLLDQPPPAPSTPSDNAHRVVVAALMTEGGADKTPGDVATAVLARVAAVDTMLGGEAASG